MNINNAAHCAKLSELVYKEKELIQSMYDIILEFSKSYWIV